MLKDIDSTLNVVYGIIDDVKLQPGNWSVKVVSYKDGWGEWITLDLAEGELFSKR